jgi:hypothetical protein
MDTREKIVEIDQLSDLLSRGEWSIVSGLFDPLTLVQAQRIAAIAAGGRKILAVVHPDENTLLTPEARAVLVAALREVDAVVVAEPQKLIMSYPDWSHFHADGDFEADRQRSADFIEFILRRQQSTEVPA